MTSGGRLDEKTQVEAPLLRQLARMGWTVVEGAGEDAATGRKDHALLGRGAFAETLLPDRLHAALGRINGALDAGVITRAVAALERPLGRDLVAINEELHGHLVGGVYLDDRADGRSRRVRFIDFDDVRKNDLLAVNQFRVDPPGARPGRGFIVPDVVLFVNGVPLVVIECKSPAAADPIANAIDQLRRYANRRDPEAREGVERLFRTNLLSVATSMHDARAASVTARPKDYLPWRDAGPPAGRSIEEEAGRQPGAGLRPQETLVAGLLRPERLLDVLRSFTVFTTTDEGVKVKVVPRYQQVRAVHAALERLRTGETRARDGMTDRRGGIIWHTQGSGKSLTMVFLIRKLRTIPELRRFKVVVVTDRTDLQRQLGETAALAGGVVHVAKDTAAAMKHLGHQEPDVTFVMIQKMRDRDRTALAGEEVRLGDDGADLGGFPRLNDSEDVLILVDEAHRSHGSTLHQALLEALPNAARIGFTGTPIEERGKTPTRRIFGAFIDTYRMRDAEADGAIVKILYEGRRVEAFVDDKAALDRLFDATFADRTDEEREAIRRRYATRTAVLNAQEPRRRKALDILRHYIENILPNGFKAQLVAASRETAADYVEDLRSARDAIVASVGGLRDVLLNIDEENAAGLDPDLAFQVCAVRHLETIARLEFAAVISAEHNDPPKLREWSDGREAEGRVRRFKKPLDQDPLAFLVVKSKLLTGFDAPVEQALYLDRPMRGAELLQAIARTNRTAGEAKKHGIVIDYHGVGRNLEEALALYDEDDRGDIGDGVAGPGSLVPELRQLVDAIRRLFAGVRVVKGDDVQAYVDDCLEALRDPKLRAAFLVKLKGMVGAYDALMPRPEAREFGADVKLYAFVAKAAANRYRDHDLDVRGVAGKVRALLDAFMKANGIDPEVPPIAILDPRFGAEVGKQAGGRAKAKDMEHALRHHITVNFDADPARFTQLSQRLEALLVAHQQDWEAIVRDFEDLINAERAAASTGGESDGPEPGTAAPIFGILREEAPEADVETLGRLAGDIAEHIRREAGVPDFWTNRAALDDCRRRVLDRIDQENVVSSYERAQNLASRCMDVASANQAAYAR